MTMLLAMPRDLCSLHLRDETEWLDACGAPYEAAIVHVTGSRDPLSILFVPLTGRAGVARARAVRWLQASSRHDAVERYLRGEGEDALW
jgi:hypothetical protein